MRRASLAAAGLGWLLVLPGAALAQEPGVHSDVDARRIGVEDVVQWSLRLEGAAVQAEGEIAVPPLKNLKVVGGPSVSTQISLVNGRMSQTKTYTWVMQPLAAGAAEIGALKLKLPSGEATAPAIAIEVGAGSLRPRTRPRATSPFGADPFGDMLEPQRARTGGKLFVEAVPSRSKVRVGEAFLLTYFIYARGVRPTDMQSSGTPQYPGFWAENVESPDPPREEEVTFEGETYLRFPIYRKLLFGTRAGDVTIPPLTVRVALARQSLFDSGMVVERSTKPVKLKVEALPAAAEAQGAVGRFKVQTTVEPRSLRLGDAATVRFRVEGSGNLKWVEKGPELVVPGAKVFPPQVKSNLQARMDGFAGSKTWEYVVVPETSGRITIPALPFTWFDPAEGKLASQEGAPIDLEVQAAANAAGLPTPVAVAPRGRGSLALRDALDRAPLLRPLSARVLLIALIVGGLL
ncbi:MAG TPA: BatD family protein, partial [Vicinamibacteria bacterium]